MTLLVGVSNGLTRGDTTGVDRLVSSRGAPAAAAAFAVVGVAVEFALPATRGVSGVLEVAVLLDARVGLRGLALARSVDIARPVSTTDVAALRCTQATGGNEMVQGFFPPCSAVHTELAAFPLDPTEYRIT